MSFAAVEWRSLRGFEDPVALHRVVGVRNLSGIRARLERATTPFVGRETELLELEAAAGDASAGRGAMVVIEGEPGIGKSRLARHFLERTGAAGWRIVEVHASPLARETAFAVLKDLLLSLPLGPYAEAQVDPDAAAPLKLEPLGSMQRAAIDSVLDVPNDLPEWQATDPLARGRASTEAVIEVVSRSVAAGRMVLLVEDLQWVDAASARALGRLAGRLGHLQLLIVGTLRFGETPAWLPSTGCRTLALRALEPRAGRAMLDSLLAGTVVADGLKAQLLERTGSVPLFLEEVCRHWASVDRWDEMGSLPIPATVQGVIASRVDRLERVERDLLRVAAALGQRVDRRELAEVADVPEPLLHRRLQALERAHLLLPLPGDVLAFPHELVRQVAYDAMPAAMRQSLHRRILHSIDGEVASARHVHHAMRGQAWDLAYEYGRQVARTSQARSALVEATHHVETALAALDRLPSSLQREQRAIDLRLESRVAFSALGRVDKWLGLAEEAQQRAVALGDARREVAARVVRAAALNFHGSAVAAVGEGEAVLRRARDLDDPGWCALAGYGLAQAYYIAGRCAEAVQTFEYGLAQLRRADGVAPLGNNVPTMASTMLAMKAMAHAFLGERHAAARCADEARGVAAESGRPFDLVAAGLATGVCQLKSGDAVTAAITLGEAAALARERDVRLFLPITLTFLGRACLTSGRPESLAVLEEAHALAREVGHLSAVTRSAIYLAAALAQAGDRQTARRLVEEALASARGNGFAGLETEGILVQAAIEEAAIADLP